MSRRDDDLAYGEYHGQEGQEGERGLVGDMGRRFGFGRKEVSTFISFETPCCHCTLHRPVEQVDLPHYQNVIALGCLVIHSPRVSRVILHRLASCRDWTRI
jgi:hypothetical protein